MPSTPTTKSQVQAYRFVLRRMQSALVRKDPDHYRAQFPDVSDDLPYVWPLAD